MRLIHYLHYSSSLLQQCMLMEGVIAKCLSKHHPFQDWFTNHLHIADYHISKCTCCGNILVHALFVMTGWEAGFQVRLTNSSVENPFAFVLGNLVWHAEKIYHLAGAQIYYGLLSAEIIRQPLS